MVGSSLQVMRKVIKFVKLSSQTVGSSGTEWSVPGSRTCGKSLDSWNCRLKQSVPVEPSGRFQFPGHAESRWIRRTVVSNSRFWWNRVVGSSFQVKNGASDIVCFDCTQLPRPLYSGRGNWYTGRFHISLVQGAQGAQGAERAQEAQGAQGLRRPGRPG